MNNLELLWHEDSIPEGPALDFSRKALLDSWDNEQASAAEAADILKQHLAWPDWVRLYPKPGQALRAAVLLARKQGRNPGVSWVAPGTGAPLEPSGGPVGLAVLRADWAPDAESMQRAQKEASSNGLTVVLDENSTALRLHPDGARGFFGLQGEMAIYGPSLAGGLELGALAGLGQAPPEPDLEPAPQALAALKATLDQLGGEGLSQKLASTGRALAEAMEYFAGQSGLSEEIRCLGPDPMPRLEGNHLWAFLDVAREEGLALNPLVLIDPQFDPGEAASNLWPRLARTFKRMLNEPIDERSPKSWPEAMKNVTKRSLEDTDR